MKQPNIKELTAQLAEMAGELRATKNDLERAHDRRREAEAKIEKLRDDRFARLDSDYRDLLNLANQQFEVIRWLVNPETAKDPFNHLERQKNNMPPRH